MANRCIRFAAVLICFVLANVREGFAKSNNSANSRPPGVILVAATVEGQPATLLLDTGSEWSCLDAGFATRLGLQRVSAEIIRQPYSTRTTDSIRVSDVALESFHLKDMDLLSSDLTSISLAVGVPIDGILGIDVLRQFTVRIDFSSGSAQFTTNVTNSASEGFVRLYPVGNLYYVPLSIQGTSVSLLLDTGTNASSVSSHAWSYVTTHWRPQSMVEGVRSSGGSGSSRFALIPIISIGGAMARNIPLRVQPQSDDGLFSNANFDGLLGTDVLRQFIVTLDLAHDRMYLKSDSNCNADIDRFSTIGIQFAKNPEGSFTIMAVWNPSPAISAGLKIGDRILAVNQRDTRQMSLEDLSSQIHGRPGTEVHLVIDSNGRRQDISMAIACLLCPDDAAGRERK